MSNAYRVSIRHLTPGEAAFIVNALEARAEEYHRQAESTDGPLMAYEADEALVNAEIAEGLALDIHTAIATAAVARSRYRITGYGTRTQQGVNR